MLLAETGRALFEHTVESVANAQSIERVVLATDSDEIVDAARVAGVECLLTSAAHKSGTDRVHEAAQRLLEDAPGSIDVILNVQGDEPEIDAADLDRLIAAFADPSVEAATLWGEITTEEEADDPCVVKIVCDAHGDALYFSRSNVPSRAFSRAGSGDKTAPKRHIGVYAYRPAALSEFVALPESALERTENLEQLRWLEAGRKMRAVEAQRVPRGIDTREDYEAFVRRQKASESLQQTKT